MVLHGQQQLPVGYDAGDSNTAANASLMARAWELIQRFRIRAWFSRVPSELNPDGIPTRGGRAPFPPMRSNRFRSLPAFYRHCRDTARTQIPADGLRFSRMIRRRAARIIRMK